MCLQWSKYLAFTHTRRMINYPFHFSPRYNICGQILYFSALRRNHTIGGSQQWGVSGVSESPLEDSLLVYSFPCRRHASVSSLPDDLSIPIFAQTKISFLCIKLESLKIALFYELKKKILEPENQGFILPRYKLQVPWKLVMDMPPLPLYPLSVK